MPGLEVAQRETTAPALGKISGDAVAGVVICQTSVDLNLNFHFIPGKI